MTTKGAKGVFRPRQSTIQSNPLDAVVPFGEAPAQEVTERPVVKPTAPTGGPAGGRKERFTVHLPQELVERIRNAAYWTPGLTLARLVAEALSDHLDRLEQERGGSFEHRAGELHAGRPVKNPKEQ